MEYATNAKGNLGVTLGAVGTGLGLLDGGANLLGRLTGASGSAMSPDDKPVTRYEMDLIKETFNQKIENSFLKGQLDTADKLAGIQKQFTEQVGFNATLAANLNAVAGQTAALQNSFNSLTRIFVPNENVAPGWGPAMVAPRPFPGPFGFPGFPGFPGVPQAPSTGTTPDTSTTTANG